MEANGAFKYVCKFCIKSFPCGRSLGGHMRSHLTNNSAEIDQKQSRKSLQDSKSTAKQNLIMDSQSDSETTVIPNRKKRSRRKTRYMGTSNSSSVVSEIEQEQEVAISLMMLSRDVGKVFFSKISVSNGNGNLNSENLKVEGKKSEFKKVSDYIKNEKVKISLPNHRFGSKDSEFELGKNFTKKCNSSKLISSIYRNRKSTHINLFPENSNPDMNSNLSRKEITIPQKRSKFECTTCNKIFHSYQALGGHRASHKKIKAGFTSQTESCENSIDTELSSNPTAENKLSEFDYNYNHFDHETGSAGYEEKAETSIGCRKSKRHVCPVCLKVFNSGQALGGHKRSHFAGGSETNVVQAAIGIEKPETEIRDFLDLNLPAPVDEESSDHVASFKPWWVGIRHKREAFVGLIPN